MVTVLFSCYMAGAMWNCYCLGACSVYTIQPCTSLQCHFISSHIYRVCVYLAVTCHLHFWQGDLEFLGATAVTLGGTDTEIRLSTECLPWRRKLFSSSCWDWNPRPFDHESVALLLSYPHHHTDPSVFSTWKLLILSRAGHWTNPRTVCCYV